MKINLGVVLATADFTYFAFVSVIFADKRDIVPLKLALNSFTEYLSIFVTRERSQCILIL